MMRRRRVLLAENPNLMRRSMTEFILSIVQTAMELDAFNQIELNHGSIPKGAEESVKYLENMIRARYRECFGTEMGQ